MAPTDSSSTRYSPRGSAMYARAIRYPRGHDRDLNRACDDDGDRYRARPRPLDLDRGGVQRGQ